MKVKKFPVSHLFLSHCGFFIEFYLHAYSVAFLKLSRYRAGKKKKKENDPWVYAKIWHHTTTGGGEKAKVAAEIFWFVRIDTPD